MIRFFVFLLLGILYFGDARAAGSFAGPIANINPTCNVVPGSLISGAFYYGLSYFYIPGVSFSYKYGPPRRPGQFLLGFAGPPLPCIFTTAFTWIYLGSGPLIIFHGSSL